MAIIDMATTYSTNEFLDNLSKSGVIPRERFDAIVVRDRLRDIEDACEVAKIFMRDGLLTRFQAERILQGRYRGLTIDDYLVKDVLGAGGMGWVYIAKEVATGWDVAIKVLATSERSNQGMLARMQLEAQAGMRLTHPNILRTHGIHKSVDSHGEFSYLVMELVRGITPLEMLAVHRRIDWQQACDLVMQAAIGLHYAHDMGLVHRDIKPENLLVRTNGAVKILDFGLAMVDENDEEFAMAMIFGQDRLGTADYVSPEQTLNSYRVDHRTDIYSLGCTLYYLLTSRVPFPVSSTVGKIQGHRKERPQSIRELRPEIPERLELIVRKMMTKRPENRIQTAAEVAQYLAPYAERKPVEFDFERVLRWRLKQARQRVTLQKLRQHHSDTLSTAAITPPQAELETRIRHDTRVHRAGSDDEPSTSDSNLSSSSTDDFQANS
ncbi:MAG: serine/threonine-protein kinase [Pirellulaceae bacterium]|nr:serine/threonine protein kinase [Planctomycetales bacterium]MCA9227792.1 serine/threonine protein kinase [Planctomycetales bacterium]